jgi:regulator of RNase E activity RraB
MVLVDRIRAVSVVAAGERYIAPRGSLAAGPTARRLADMLRSTMTHQPVPDLWESYPALANGKPALFLVNMGLLSVAPLSAAPAIYFVTVAMRDPGPNGVGTAEESESFSPIEDAFGEAAAAAGLYFPGRVRTDGRWEFGFYGPADVDVHAMLEGIGPLLADLDVTFGDNDDPEWRYALEYLAPDRERWQWILDYRVVRQLEKSGDNPEKPRVIDHVAHFRDSAAVDAFVAHAATVGFVESQRHEEPDAESPYPWMVEMQREDPVTIDHIHDVVMDLIERVEAHDGDYDGWGCAITR